MADRRSRLADQRGGTQITILTLDWLNRPWAQQWETNVEKGMSRPEGNALFGF